MVLPLFSEYCLREYLGIELLVKALKESDYQVHCIDLNEKLVDYLLSNKAILHGPPTQNILPSTCNLF
ncbi:MAG: hypothetical protein JRI99_15165 [Deltaproteobacteria bacterium]|nr:hypothetical protein [Deltaproteobacteria bacterium]